MPYYEVVSQGFHFGTRDIEEAERVLHEQIGRSFQNPDRPDVSLLADGRGMKTFTHPIRKDAE